MKTRRAFSTISYNTISFLRVTLEKMIVQGKIDFYAFIEHMPEEDELKKHIHLYVEPCGEINTTTFCNELLEVDTENIDSKPLGCIRCVPSKFPDWYMYVLHDKDYLATKLETRKYNYDDSAIVCPDKDVLNELIHTSDFTKYKAFKKFRESVESGVSFQELFKNGFIPVQQINQYERAYYLMRGEDMPSRTFRGGRSNHESESVQEYLVDSSTGEVIGKRLGPHDSAKVNTIMKKKQK